MLYMYFFFTSGFFCLKKKKKLEEMTFDDNAGAKVGIEVWRIEKMEPVRQEFTGSLYSGDCYIIMKVGQCCLLCFVFFFLNLFL